MVPLSVTVGGTTIPDGTWTLDEFFERMDAEEELPTTSQPSVGAFIEAYERALENANSVVSVHISDKLSGTLSSARAAAENFSGRVHIVDSRNLSWGLGLQVIEAAKAAASGMSPEAVAEQIERLRERVQLFVAFDGMENVVKGGRLSATAGRLTTVLNVKLTIECNSDGELVPSRLTRGKRGALQHGLKWMDGHMGDAKRGIFCVIDAMAPDRVEKVKEHIEEHYEAEELYMVQPGSVIATHTGRGWGVTFLPLD